jgi:hypothetical protein
MLARVLAFLLLLLGFLMHGNLQRGGREASQRTRRLESARWERRCSAALTRAAWLHHPHDAPPKSSYAIHGAG